MVRTPRLRRRPLNRREEDPPFPSEIDQSDFERAERSGEHAAERLNEAESLAAAVTETAEAAERAAVRAIRAAYRAVEAATWVVWDANRRLDEARQRVEDARALLSAERQVLADMPSGDRAFEHADSGQRRALQSSFEAAERAQQAASQAQTAWSGGR
jgi:hypothetical protein